MPTAEVTRPPVRDAILTAAARLLREGGPMAMTTRGVAEAAGVQAPTIYRLFGDKDGLLEAVAEHVMVDFVAGKTASMTSAATEDVDPVDDLRASWHTQIDFGLANPAVFSVLSDLGRLHHSPAARAGQEVLAARVRRIAAAGRLDVPESRAVALTHAAGMGAVHTLLATPTDRRDPVLADDLMEAVLARILIRPAPAPSVSAPPLAAAVTLRALAPDLDALSPPERRLLVEWLDRITAASDAACR